VPDQADKCYKPFSSCLLGMRYISDHVREGEVGFQLSVAHDVLLIFISMLVWRNEDDEKRKHHAAEGVEICPVMRARISKDHIRPIKQSV
jgi:hypothetical protein